MQAVDLILGSYQEADEGAIRFAEVDQRSGRLDLLSELYGAKSPTYLLWSEHSKVLYAVEEALDFHGVCCFVLQDGRFVKQPSFTSGGQNPCHLTITPDASHLIVSNYMDGVLTVFHLDEHGLIAGQSDRVDFNRLPQKLKSAVSIEAAERLSHMHFAAFLDGKDEFVAVDLGKDSLYRLCLNKAGQVEIAHESVHLPKGSGPRHFCQDKDDSAVLYVAAELDSHLYCVNLNTDTAVYTDLGHSSPLGQMLNPAAAENHPSGIIATEDGRYIMVANRGSQTVSCFRRLAPGKVEFSDECICGGLHPRDLTLLGHYVYTANQYSGTIGVLRFDAEKGTLSLQDYTYPLARAAFVKPIKNLCLTKL